jgi:alkylation response protein AidB-like acyl-CoA dehydrogenase
MTVSSVEMLLIAARAVFLLFSFALAAVAFTRWRRAAQAHTAQLQANHQVVLLRLADLEARVAATNVAVSRLGERVERPQQLAAAPAAPAPGYQIAIRLAKGGASLDELISGCGLSIHEAELVHRLHAPQSRMRSGQKPRLVAAVEPDVR